MSSALEISRYLVSHFEWCNVVKIVLWTCKAKSAEYMHISVVSTVNADQVYVPQAEPERYLKD